MKCDCGGVQEVAKRPAGISGSVTYGNRVKALVGDLYCELLSMYRAADHYNQHPEIGSRQHYMECLKRGKIRALIDRLRTYKGEVCRFADNPIVPFTNNQAERDLRMVRMKSKVIGTFRSEDGAKDFLLLKSLTSTAAKVGFTAFDALFSLFCGQLDFGTE